MCCTLLALKVLSKFSASVNRFHVLRGRGMPAASHAISAFFMTKGYACLRAAQTFVSIIERLAVDMTKPR